MTARKTIGVTLFAAVFRRTRLLYLT